MPRASVRIEKKLLREQMTTQGLPLAEIAAEFGRRYTLRPRQAWREARGWSLSEAVAYLNAFKGDIGLDPGGRCTMTGPHLSEQEHWPGIGPAPRGRRPTPYVLALLAAVYGCGPADLLDTDDRAFYPASDLFVIQTLPSARPPQSLPAGQDPSPGRQSVLLAPGSAPVIRITLEISAAPAAGMSVSVHDAAAIPPAVEAPSSPPSAPQPDDEGGRPEMAAAHPGESGARYGQRA